MCIDTIRKMMQRGIIITEHAKRRMRERGVCVAEVRNAINLGAIIENYPTRKPRPACLISHNDLHIVISTNGKRIFLVTCYRPSCDYFEDDNKTRRPKVW